jgi:hypothetical protein
MILFVEIAFIGKVPISNTQYPTLKEMENLKVGYWKFDIGYFPLRRVPMERPEWCLDALPIS